MIMEKNTKLMIEITVILLTIIGWLVGIGIKTQSNANLIINNTTTNTIHIDNSTTQKTATPTQDLNDVRPSVSQ